MEALLQSMSKARQNGTLPNSFMLRPEFFNPDGSAKPEAFNGFRDPNRLTDAEMRVIAMNGSLTYDVAAGMQGLMRSGKQDQRIHDSVIYYLGEMLMQPRAYYNPKDKENQGFVTT